MEDQHLQTPLAPPPLLAEHAEPDTLSTSAALARPAFALNVDWFTLAFWGVVIVAAILRFYDLAAKPMHHDESLYGVYCWRFFKGEWYRYDPMMHGPFMFHFQALLFFVFGVGEFSVRMGSALFGVLMIASVYWLKDMLGKVGALAVAVMLAVSPTHLYFTRFMREDAFVALFTLAAVVFALLYARRRQPRWLYLTAAALALMFCEKENAYIHAFIFLTFIILQDLARVFVIEKISVHEKMKRLAWVASLGLIAIPIAPLLIFLKIPAPQALLALMPADRWAMLLLVAAHIVAFVWIVGYWLYQRDTRPSGDAQPYIFAVLIAASVFVWIYIFFYSTMFTNRMGVVDGMAKSWTYWWNQHTIQRIKGPFHYYVPLMWQYELPIFAIAIVGLLCMLADSLNKRIIAVWAAVFPVIVIVLFGHKPLPLWLAFTHMEIWADLVLTLWVLGIGAWAVLHFWLEREWLLAFLTYYSGMSFLIYAYAGEKVPWLFLHILMPVALLAGMFVQRFAEWFAWRERHARMSWLRWATVVVVGLFSVYTLHVTVLLNYYHPANPVETMVYTQTSTDMLKLVQLAEDLKFTLGAEEAQKPLVAVQGNAVWPLAWYFRDYDGWYMPGDLTNVDRPLIVIDWEERDKYQDVFGEDYQEIRVKLREWWIPKPDATLKEWWQYFVYRKVFNPTGSSDVALYVRRQ